MMRGRAKSDPFKKPNADDAMVHYVTKYTTKDNMVYACILVLQIG